MPNSLAPSPKKAAPAVSGHFDAEFYHANVRYDVLPALPAWCGRILDVGGGTGATSAFLKTHGRASEAVVADRYQGNPAPEVDEIIAIDLNDAEAFAQIEERGPFDTILCLDVLEHLQDPWQMVDNLQKCLVPGGRLIASIPNVNYLAVVAPLILRGHFEYKASGILDRTHIRWFTRKSASELMSRSGLIIEQVLARVPPGQMQTLNALFLKSLERFFTLQYVIRSKAHAAPQAISIIAEP